MNCPNCGNERSLRFCAHCGQNDRDYIRSLPPLMSDILRETFELDSRVARTVRLLITKPGELSAEFSRNRRASYSSPIRLYLFVSLVFFFLLSITAGPDRPRDRVDAMHLKVEQAREAVDVEALKAVLSAEQRFKVDEIVSRPRYAVAKLFVYGMAASLADREDKPNQTERFFYAQMVDVLHTPRLAMERLVDNLPISMFFMLPAYTLLLAAIYRRKRRFYVEHFVFGIHVHTVAFAAFAVLLLLPEGVIGDIAHLALVFALAAYYFAALLRYYGDGPALTTVKWGLLMVTYTIILIPGLLVAMFVTLYGL